MKDSSGINEELLEENALLKQRIQELESSETAPREDKKTFVHRVGQLMYQGKRTGNDRLCCES